MIDVANEKLIAVTSAAEFIPGRPSTATLWRWVLRGVRGVKLETVVCGARRFTSRSAIERFIAATTAAANGEPAPSRTPRARAASVAAAMKELEAAGV